MSDLEKCSIADLYNRWLFKSSIFTGRLCLWRDHSCRGKVGWVPTWVNLNVASACPPPSTQPPCLQPCWPNNQHCSFSGTWEWVALRCGDKIIIWFGGKQTLEGVQTDTVNGGRRWLWSGRLYGGLGNLSWGSLRCPSTPIFYQWEGGPAPLYRIEASCPGTICQWCVDPGNGGRGQVSLNYLSIRIWTERGTAAAERIVAPGQGEILYFGQICKTQSCTRQLHFNAWCICSVGTGYWVGFDKHGGSAGYQRGNEDPRLGQHRHRWDQLTRLTRPRLVIRMLCLYCCLIVENIH